MSIRYELIGAAPPDGGRRRRWRFGDPSCPLRLAKTPTGLGGAPFAHTRQSNARQAGGTWRGRVDDVNIVGLDVLFGPVEPGDGAVHLWHEWRQSLGYGDRLAEFHVYSPKGWDRWQYVRLESPAREPALDGLIAAGFMSEHVNLGSDVSWWESKPLDYTFTLADPAPASILSRATVPSWARWTITGPGTFTLGLDGEAVTLPALTAGQVWEIETDPEGPYIRDAATGADRWDQVGVKAWFKPAAAGRTSTLTASCTDGTAESRIELRLPQLWTEAVA